MRGATGEMTWVTVYDLERDPERVEMYQQATLGDSADGAGRPRVREARVLRLSS
jgi:hypothetical protein